MPLRKALIDLMYYNGNPPGDDLVTLAADGDPAIKKLYASLLSRAKEVIKNIHEKKITAGDIDKEMVSLTHQILMDGVTKGLKVDWNKVDYETDDGLKLKALQTHVFKFSACKNYQEVQSMSRMLTDEKGNIRSFDEFRKVAGKVDSTFNGSWLRTEYNQAQVTATRIADYNRMENMTDVYPTWQYKTRADGHVREPHKALHDMKLAANDPAWNAISPTNGWNCRCWVKPLSDDPPHTGKGEEAIAKLRSTIVNKKTGMSEWDNMVKQGFNQNFAKTGTCYPANHEYFKAQEAPAVKDAVQNFKPKTYTDDDIELLKTKRDYKMALDAVTSQDRFKQYSHMDKHELAAIYDYSGSAFQELNSNLAMKIDHPYSRSMERVLNFALDQLPNDAQGKYFRGKALPAEVIGLYKKHYEEGTPKTEFHFTSSSRAESIATDFSNKEPGKSLVLFLIEGKNGKYIGPISKNQGEREVLFKSKTRFNVKEFKEITENGETRYEIGLEEYE